MSAQGNRNDHRDQAAPPWLDSRFEKVLRHRAFLLTGQRATAEDLLQDTYERALRSPIVTCESEAAVVGWLSRIMHNRFIDEKRSARCRVSVSWDEDDPAHHPANDVFTEPARWRRLSDEDLSAFIDELPLMYREILALKRGRLSTRAIAARLGIDCGTVGTRYFRARARLRALAEAATAAAADADPLPANDP